MANVFVVEDEPITAADVEHRLTLLGHTVTWFDTGEEVVAHAKSAPCDLVLMDIRLRGQLTGIEAARQIRAQRDVPVVFLTAFADQATVNQACSTEPYGYLVKPFTDRSLASAVQVALTRAKSDRAHLERERWLTAAVRSTGEAVIAVDETAAIRFMNAEAEALFGTKSDAALGRDVRDMVQFSVDDSFQLPLQRALQAEQLSSSRAYISPAGAGALLVQCSVAPVRTADGSKRGAVLVLRKLQPLAAGAGAVGWDALGARLAHEINNPLTVTMGGLTLAIHELDELLAVEALEAPHARAQANVAALQQVSELLQDAHSGASRIATAMKELTALSLGSSKHVPLQLADLVQIAIGMSGVATTSVQWLPNRQPAPLINGSKLQLAATISECIRSTEAELRRRHASVGSIEIQLGTGPDGWAELNVVAHPVKGMPLGDAAAQETFSATLGTTVAQHIVEAHGGSLNLSWVAAEPTLTVRLPPRSHTASIHPGSDQDARGTIRGDVLIVDDEPTVRRLLQIALRAHHDLTAVASVHEALALLESGKHFDAIVCDVTMPEAGGRVMYEHLHRTQPEIAARMLFITGGALNEIDASFIEAMTGRHLVKPFSPTELAALISAKIRACFTDAQLRG